MVDDLVCCLPVHISVFVHVLLRFISYWFNAIYLYGVESVFCWCLLDDMVRLRCTGALCVASMLRPIWLGLQSPVPGALSPAGGISDYPTCGGGRGSCPGVRVLGTLTTVNH